MVVKGVLALLWGVAVLLGGWLGKDALRKWRVRELVEAAIPIAYHVVNEIAQRTTNKIDDKVALGLGVLKEYLRTEGVKDSEITEAQLAKARFIFDALHAQERSSQMPTVIVADRIEVKEGEEDGTE